MGDPETVTQQPRKQRPPPFPLAPPEPTVLKELETGLGLVLWKALRDVRTWAEVDPEDRRRHFRVPTDDVRERYAYASQEAPDLKAPLTVFARLVEAPDSVIADDLASACESVYAWAETRGFLCTAHYFAEAAAIASPSDSARANQAARAARRASMRQRAAIWHYRAYRIAQRTGKKKEVVWALLGYGAMMRDAGNFKEARRFTERAARRAVALRKRKEAGMAYHDLYVIAVEQERYALAIKHARNAFDWYPVRNPSIPRLAHDLSFLFIRLHHYGAAIAIINRALPLMLQPVERALAWSSLAWAAGCAGLRDRYTDAERTALELVPAHPDFAPAIFIHLAEGGRALSDWDRALRYAEAARVSAQTTQSPTLEREAVELIASITARQAPPPPAAPAFEVESLTSLVLERLERWKPPRTR
jgi:tetratricopeptide (TPR) repeat protein